MTTRRDFLSVAGLASLWTSGLMAADAQAMSGVAATPGTSDYLLAPGLVYLNTGSTGPSTRAVLEATIAAWRQLESNPVQQSYDAQALLGSVEQVRAKAAAFLGCSSDELLITRSTSEGMNTVAQSMRLSAGDRILTTDQEHEGGTECWQYLVERRGIILDTVSVMRQSDDRSIVAGVAAAIRPETKAISVSHVLWTTGRTMPIQQIAALARERNILCIVDGAQAVGAMPVDVKALGCHAYATTGHKWLLGPKGLGLLYISADAADDIKPVQWMRMKRYVGPSVGVGPLVLVMGLGVAIDAARSRGLVNIERHNIELRNRAYAGLKAVKGIDVASGAPGESISALVSCAIPNAIVPGQLMQTLLKKHAVQIKSFRAPFNGIRLSPHVFNSAADIDKAVKAIQQELA